MRTRYNGMSATKIEHCIFDSNIALKDTRYIVIDPLFTEKYTDMRQYLVTVDLSTASEDCQIVTYSNARVLGDIASSLEKVNDNIYLKSGEGCAYDIIITYNTQPSTCSLQINKIKSFKDL